MAKLVDVLTEFAHGTAIGELSVSEAERIQMALERRWEVSLDLGTYLGRGAMGVVFGFDSKALKITGDMSELEAASILIANPHDAIVPMHDAVLLVLNDRRIGAILREAIIRLGADELPEEEQYELWYDFLDSLRNNMGIWPERLALMPLVRRRQKLRQAQGKMIRFLETIRYEHPVFETILDASLHLRKNRIYTVDLHFGNIGVYRGSYVVFDIGVSTTRPVDVEHVRANPRRTI